MGAWIADTTIAHEHGGIDEAARVVAAQLAPAALAAAGVGALARRVGLRRVLCGGLFLQGTLLLGIGILLWADAPNLAVYALAVVGAVAVVTTRPTVAAVMPLVVEGPNELTAANSLIGWLDGACMMIGPIITGAGFALVGLSAPFTVFAALTTIAGLTALRIAPRRTPSVDRPSPVDLGPSPADPTRGDPPATGRPSLGPVLVVLAMGGGGARRGPGGRGCCSSPPFRRPRWRPWHAKPTSWRSRRGLRSSRRASQAIAST